MDMSLGKLRELVMDREAGMLQFMGWQQSDTTERLNWTGHFQIYSNVSKEKMSEIKSLSSSGSETEYV